MLSRLSWLLLRCHKNMAAAIRWWCCGIRNACISQKDAAKRAPFRLVSRSAWNHGNDVIHNLCGAFAKQPPSPPSWSPYHHPHHPTCRPFDSPCPSLLIIPSGTRLNCRTMKMMCIPILIGNHGFDSNTGAASSVKTTRKRTRTTFANK